MHKEVTFGRQNVALLRPGLIYGSYETSSAEWVTSSVFPAYTLRIWRTSRLSSGVLVLWPRMASGRYPWCFPSCQNCSIKRTH
jgi:hypothetical protein